MIPVVVFPSILPEEEDEGIFTARAKIYETDLANHGIHFVQEPQDTIIKNGDSAILTAPSTATTCHYGINQGKVANTDIQAPSGKTLAIPQFGIIGIVGGEFRGFKIMASDTVDTDNGTELYSGSVGASVVYVPYPIYVPANKYLTLVYTSQPFAGRNLQATKIVVIEENTA